MSPTLAAGLLVWRLASGVVTPDDGADVARPAGSLQKAWVVKAWAMSHPDSALPRTVCDPASRCWLPAGHGEMGLRAATARSCNVWFRRLAAETPERARADALREAGFDTGGAVSPEASIGLHAGEVLISPRRLLAAYAELVSTPWAIRDDARREWLEGMRDAAEDGTAKGLPLRGLLVKTGTVPALDGRPLGTSGWALVLDPSGASGWLALLPRGSGAGAAEALGALLVKELPTAVIVARPEAPRAARRPRSQHPVPGAPRELDVRVRLFTSLRGSRVSARNLGSGPIRFDGRGATRWIGPGDEIPLTGDDRLAEGLFELHVEPYGLTRIVRGAIEARGRRDGPVQLVLSVSRRDYVDGVIRGELRTATPERAEELAAAVLRFLARGTRHGGEDVCDLTHCARFIGLGPDVVWTTPFAARRASGRDPLAEPAYLDDAAWNRVALASSRPGPASWTANCGGRPLPEHAVWGTGSVVASPCPRHPSGAPPWTRTIPGSALASALGAPVETLESVEDDGVRATHVVAGGTDMLFRYDDLHRLLASSIGWDALPSPPDRFERVDGGWRVTGRGSGHRVGVCLAD